MDILIRYGFSIEEIKNMMDSNDSIESVPDKDILELINILIKVGCHEEHIMNIFSCNPFVISRNLKEINKLIDKMYSLGFDYLYMLFDSNPYLLNINDVDFEEIYNKKINEGMNNEEVVDYFFHNIVLG